VFVGIPFSASSAITKELIENYEGEFILSKHTNIPTLINELEININKYFVFGVYRSPIEILKSRYNKLRNNPCNRFSDKKYLRKNGGFVSEKAQRLSKLIREKNLTFIEYFEINFKILPYNNEFTLNAPFLNYIIDFNNLKIDFTNALKQIGLKNESFLNKLNKTEKRTDIDYKISDSILSKYISPFLVYNSKYIPNYQVPKVNYCYYLIFLLTNRYRKNRFLKTDLQRTMKFDMFFSK
jgi:hypothetical protein